MAVTLLPLLVALLHATGLLPLPVVQRLDDVLYDARLRATMPRTLEPRIVIVDIDERSLAEVGRWPWSRNRMAALADELFQRQRVAVAAFDIVFAEADESSGLQRLRLLAAGELKDQPGFAARIEQIAPALDYDALFARALDGRPAVLGYYFTSDREGGTTGVLPEPVLRREDLHGRPIRFTSWNGYGANIAPLARAAPVAGFFNPIADTDGSIRSVPLLAEYQERFYESLALAVLRVLTGRPPVQARLAPDVSRSYHALDSIVLRLAHQSLAIPVDDRVAALVPYRGPGGARGGSFRYVSAADLLAQRVPAGSLQGKIVLVGTTAPGLQDLRTTPVGEAYPGVEVHANLISGLLDGSLPVRPDYGLGYDIVVLLIAGLLLAIALPLLSAPLAVVASVAVLAAVVALNFWLHAAGLVMPLAAAMAMVVTAFTLNMSYGYFVESRSKRELANLFGTYVPPELVDEMVKDPDSYSMQAANKELTVMFCDMRGFTALSEKMEPVRLQQMLNSVFNRLTDIIRSNRGTIDKYMGDCVMAFWGAPVETGDHAALAVASALDMAAAVRRINEEHRAAGLPEVGVGIGLNTGVMCVGDMGSQARRSYTVIGDAVNLASRLEGLSKVYRVEVVASQGTRQLAPGFEWQELDRVRVKGKEQAVAIFTPRDASGDRAGDRAAELSAWNDLLRAYREQDWDRCGVLLLNLKRMNPTKYLYELYSERVASMRLLPFDPDWDGATSFDTK